MSAAKRMLADVFWEAANEHLASRLSQRNNEGGVFMESCCAVLEVIQPGWLRDGVDFQNCTRRKPLAFLRSLGCTSNTYFFSDEFSRESERQGVRYMWLLLAMHVAEDEGLTA